jgi:protein-S-isoprenylcysteine O-methyltransferase Ste14
MQLAVRASLAIAASALYLWLAAAGLGGLRAFLSHPPLIALAGIFAALTIAALFAGGNVSPGIREDRGNRWVLAVVIVIGVVAAYVPAWNDRIGFWTVDGDAVRWLGVAILAVGGSLRILPVFVLGNRFSGLVAIQSGHTLVTTGMYSVIRHPSYLGLLLSSLGWALAFRSILGALLALALVPPILARIDSEEALLHSQFGDEYDRYRARTSRLLPGVY